MEVNLNEIKLAFAYHVAHYSGNVNISKGAVIGVLAGACGNDTSRHMVLQWLTGKWSSKALTDAEFYALHDLVQPIRPLGEHWQSARGNHELKTICDAIITDALKSSGQMEMEMPHETKDL